MNSKLFFGLLIVSLMMVSLLMGCSGSSNSSYIELNDPGAGMVGTVAVGSDGVFKGEFKNGKSVGNLDGRVTSAGEGTYSIRVSYERKTYTTDSAFKSDQIKCELTTLANAEISIGKNPNQQQPDKTNSLEELSIELVKPGKTN